jgi:hypothetical protein
MCWTLLLAVGLQTGCSEYGLKGQKPSEPGGDDPPLDTDLPDIPEDCELDLPAADELGSGSNCSAGTTGGFTPVVEWTAGNQGCLAMPVVADLNGYGLPEVLVNESVGLGKGTMRVYEGDGSGLLFSLSADVGYGSPAAVGDIDGDGSPDIIVVNEYSSSLRQRELHPQGLQRHGDSDVGIGPFCWLGLRLCHRPDHLRHGS